METVNGDDGDPATTVDLAGEAAGVAAGVAYKLPSPIDEAGDRLGEVTVLVGEAIVTDRLGDTTVETVNGDDGDPATVADLVGDVGVAYRLPIPIDDTGVETVNGDDGDPATTVELTDLVGDVGVAYKLRIPMDDACDGAVDAIGEAAVETVNGDDGDPATAVDLVADLLTTGTTVPDCARIVEAVGVAYKFPSPIDDAGDATGVTLA